jgi:peptidoglycan hydrolase-like protein with peptidoglycan-binding domain/3D (Asp-Asp-Asp) domain-containing protein
MQTQIQKFFGVLLSLAIFAGFAPPSFAATDFEPYDATFVISAYYSPLPNQRVYFRGSFEADKRLNGNGTNGADGTQVYPGMLAAPKSYPFGMKIAIPGLGVGAIHDRGGAIVQAGERAIATHDRLDVWMGKGEAGLARALQWGVRTVHAKVYSASHTIAESFTLPATGSVFVAELKIGDSGDQVQKLQEELKTYGYFRAPVDGFFNEATGQALLGYQLARRIVASADSAGAGMLGPQTRESLNAEVFQRSWQPPASLLAKTNATSGSGAAVIQKNITESSRFPTTLSIGDRGGLVRDLQIALTESGFYECEINGIYDARMEDCVFNFQESNGVLASRDEFGAGYFGLQTRLALTTSLDERDSEFSNLIAAKIPSKTFSLDDEGEEVVKLQEGLKELGFLGGEISSVFDEATVAAVTEFQVSSGTLASSTSYGAGFFGPKTLAAFQKTLQQNLLALPSLPQNPEWNRAVWIAYTPQFKNSLSLGDSNEEVEKLQKVLQKLGYSELEISGEFDEVTENAIIDFQIKSEILASAEDFGAGSFGPKTRTALNSLLEKEKIALKEQENSAA